MSESPAIIEIALNGATQSARNIHVANSPAEITAQSLRCLEIGAAIIHTHLPMTDYGLPAEQAAHRYQESYQAILARFPEAILYPTVGAGATMIERLGHIEHLARNGLIRCGFIDPGSTLLGWANDDGSPSKDSFLYVNTFADMEVALEQCTRLKLGASIAIFEPGFLRNAMSYYRLGRIPPGAMIKFYFGGERGYMGWGKGVSFGLPPTETGLNAYLEMMELAGCTLPWSVAVMGGDIFDTPVARLALEKGGHIHTGLEDHAGNEQPSNEELCKKAVELCRHVGRPVASCSQAEKLMGLPLSNLN